LVETKRLISLTAKVCVKKEYPSVKLNNGTSMPSFGLGTWLSQPGEVSAAVKIALNAGYKHIDGASCYGNEVEVGQAYNEYFNSPGAVKRQDVYLVSKLWVKDFGRVKEACQRQLKQLQLDYLDLYLMHLPFEVEGDHPRGIPDEDGTGLIGYDAKRVSEVWAEMEKLVDEGLVKSIGVSNFSSKKINTLLASSPKIVPATNQVELHPYLPQKALLETCKQHGIVLTAYSPLGGPGRTDKADDELNLLEDEIVTAIAKKHSCTNAQVLFKWGIQRGTPVIPKSTNEKRIKENLECLKVQLDEEDMGKLNGIETRYRFIKQLWAITPGNPVDSIWDGEYLG